MDRFDWIAEPFRALARIRFAAPWRPTEGKSAPHPRLACCGPGLPSRAERIGHLW